MLDSLRIAIHDDVNEAIHRRFEMDVEIQFDEQIDEAPNRWPFRSQMILMETIEMRVLTAHLLSIGDWSIP